jgi:hypothetical protein
MCTVRRGVLVGESWTGDIYVGRGAPWSWRLGERIFVVGGELAKIKMSRVDSLSYIS